MLGSQRRKREIPSRDASRRFRRLIGPEDEVAGDAVLPHLIPCGGEAALPSTSVVSASCTAFHDIQILALQDFGL